MKSLSKLAHKALTLSAAPLAMLAAVSPVLAAPATFNNPSGVTIGGGIVYVADYGAVRKIAAGVVTTLAGPSATTGGCVMGYANGTGAAARFNYISAITIAISGNLYVTEHTNNTVRKITPAGVVTTVAGLGPTSNLPMAASVDGLPSVATFNHPTGIAVDPTETYLYVNDTYDYSVRRIKVSTGEVKTMVAGRFANIPGENGIGNPTAIVMKGGKIYVAEQAYSRIRVIDPALYTGTPLLPSSLPTIASAPFALNHPAGLAVDNAGKVYVSEGNGNGPGQGNLIKSGTLSGLNLTTTVVAGAPNSSGTTNGLGAVARFNTPAGMVVNGAGAILFIADQRNHKIRRMATAFPYAVATYAGNSTSTYAGCEDGSA